MQISFLDTLQSSPSSSTRSRHNACGSRETPDGSQGCKCSKETFGCSIHPTWRDEWIASMQDSLAKIFQSPVLAQALKEAEAAFGRRLPESLARYDHENCSWRTAQPSLLGDSDEFSETWPSWGTMLNDACYQRPQSVPRTYVLDGGVSPDNMLPMPTATTAKQGPGSTAGGSSAGRPLLHRAQMTWPTPCASASKGSSPNALTRRNGKSRENDRIDHAVMASDGGQLNPVWVEWLMGWPLGATESRHLETVKSRSRRRSRT